MNLLDDQNKFVLESTLTGFCRIFEFHANVFLQSVMEIVIIAPLRYVYDQAYGTVATEQPYSRAIVTGNS